MARGLLSDLFRDHHDACGWLSEQGHIYRLGEAALNTTITGATSFATTTPTIDRRIRGSA